MGDGGSSETLTLEAYFAELEVIIDDFDDEVDARNEENVALLAEMNEDVDAFLADEANLPVFQDLIVNAERPRLLGEMLERLNALTPPPEVEDAHNAFVEAGLATKLVLEEHYDVVHATGTIGELLALDISTTTARDALTEACLELVAIGRDRGLSPAIGCGGVF